MNERKLIREFLDNMAYASSVNHDNHENEDHVLEPQHDFSSHSELDPDGDGHITPEDLYSHFDLNNNGHVTTQDYVNHIDFHCKHPESLEHYNTARSESIHTVPCVKSYDSCSQHLMSCPDDIDKYLKPLMDCTGSSCRQSSARALMDVLQSLVNCGVFN